MARPEEYGISVRLVQEDGADLYEARVAELPDVRVYGQSHTEAYEGAIDVIRTTQEIFAEKGKAFPNIERSEGEFSGRVTLRMSKSLHRTAHMRAQQDGVSLNQWIVESVGSRASTADSQVGEKYMVAVLKYAHSGSMWVTQPAAHIGTFQPSSGSFVKILVPHQDALSFYSTEKQRRPLSSDSNLDTWCFE